MNRKDKIAMAIVIVSVIFIGTMISIEWAKYPLAYEFCKERGLIYYELPLSPEAKYCVEDMDDGSDRKHKIFWYPEGLDFQGLWVPG